MRRCNILAGSLAFFLCAQSVFAETVAPNEKKPRIEVCFVLDTTGSMGDLLEGAKQKIWAIANDMISAKPTPELKIGLVGFRDRGDEYVVRPFPLTDDIDAMYEHLRAFQAGGGGDTPESVNEALDEAINKIKWSEDRNVLKIIFLVGDAPPHMDYENGPKYPELCRAAAKKDLIINTVQCGSIGETTPIWKEIAKMAEGSYAAIPQSGGVAVITTPMDEKLAELNRRLGTTLIPYGDSEIRHGVMAKQRASESAPAPAAADRLNYNMRSKKSVQGAGELLDALASGELKLEAVEQKNLPPELQKLSREELKARIEKTREERAALQKEIADVSKKRDTYIAEETKRLAAAGKGDSFDEKVAQIIRTEAARKGIRY